MSESSDPDYGQTKPRANSPKVKRNVSPLTSKCSDNGQRPRRIPTSSKRKAQLYHVLYAAVLVLFMCQNVNGSIRSGYGADRDAVPSALPQEVDFTTLCRQNRPMKQIKTFKSQFKKAIDALMKQGKELTADVILQYMEKTFRGKFKIPVAMQNVLSEIKKKINTVTNIRQKHILNLPVLHMDTAEYTTEMAKIDTMTKNYTMSLLDNITMNIDCKIGSLQNANINLENGEGIAESTIKFKEGEKPDTVVGDAAASSQIVSAFTCTSLGLQPIQEGDDESPERTLSMEERLKKLQFLARGKETVTAEQASVSPTNDKDEADCKEEPKESDAGKQTLDHTLSSLQLAFQKLLDIAIGRKIAEHPLVVGTTLKFEAIKSARRSTSNNDKAKKHEFEITTTDLVTKPCAFKGDKVNVRGGATDVNTNALVLKYKSDRVIVITEWGLDYEDREVAWANSEFDVADVEKSGYYIKGRFFEAEGFFTTTWNEKVPTSADGTSMIKLRLVSGLGDQDLLKGGLEVAFTKLLGSIPQGDPLRPTETRTEQVLGDIIQHGMVD